MGTGQQVWIPGGFDDLAGKLGDSETTWSFVVLELVVTSTVDWKGEAGPTGVGTSVISPSRFGTPKRIQVLCGLSAP